MTEIGSFPAVRAVAGAECVVSEGTARTRRSLSGRPILGTQV